MSDPTPGPWLANGAAIIAKDVGRTLHVAKVWGSGGTSGCDWSKTDEANAALIASAPDLLDALTKVVACLESEAPGRAAQVARKAIKKARAA